MVNIHQLRPGQPEDRISFSTGYDYQVSDRNSQEYLSAQQLLLDLFGTMEIKDYVLSNLSLMLFKPSNKYKINYLIGNQSNRKFLIDQLKISLGQYMKTIDWPVMIDRHIPKKSSNGVDINMHGIRLLTFDVLNICDVNLRVGSIKDCVLNDFPCNGHWEYLNWKYDDDPTHHTSFHTIFNLPTQELPTLRATNIDDQLYWRLIDLYPLDNRQNTFVPSQGISGILFFNILADYFHTAIHGISQPALIRTMIDNYKSEQDYVAKFFKNQLEVSAQSSLTKLKFYSEFRSWFTESYPNQKPSTRKDVYLWLNDKHYLTETNINGFRLKQAPL